MDCKEVRDRFSSLWEEELDSHEEKNIKEHLTRCPECRKELERFEKTMAWLHSAGEIEVPDRFLIELLKKVKERKKASSAGKVPARWGRFSLSWKLPVQAAAMVTIVFLVLYLTRMMPIGVAPLKESGHPSVPASTETKPGPVLSQDKLEKGRTTTEIRPGIARSKNIVPSKAPGQKEERSGKEYSPIWGDVKKTEMPSPQDEAAANQTAESKETARTAVSSPEPAKNDERSVLKEKPAMAPFFKAPQEIVLKISDPEKMVSKVQELVKKSGGEIVSTEGGILLASLPTPRFTEFKKELTDLSSSKTADHLSTKKQGSPSMNVMSAEKGEIAREKRKEPETQAGDQGNRTVVRIVLIKE